MGLLDISESHFWHRNRTLYDEKKNVYLHLYFTGLDYPDDLETLVQDNYTMCPITIMYIILRDINMAKSLSPKLPSKWMSFMDVANKVISDGRRYFPNEVVDKCVKFRDSPSTRQDLMDVRYLVDIKYSAYRQWKCLDDIHKLLKNEIYGGWVIWSRKPYLPLLDVIKNTVEETEDIMSKKEKPKFYRPYPSNYIPPECPKCWCNDMGPCTCKARNWKPSHPLTYFG